MTDHAECRAAERVGVRFVLIGQIYSEAGHADIPQTFVSRIAFGQMTEVIGEFEFDLLARAIFESIFQDRARQSGILIIQRNEWIKSRYADV